MFDLNKCTDSIKRTQSELENEYPMDHMINWSAWGFFCYVSVQVSRFCSESDFGNSHRGFLQSEFFCVWQNRSLWFSGHWAEIWLNFFSISAGSAWSWNTETHCIIYASEFSKSEQQQNQTYLLFCRPNLRLSAARKKTASIYKEKRNNFLI